MKSIFASAVMGSLGVVTHSIKITAVCPVGALVDIWNKKGIYQKTFYWKGVVTRIIAFCFRDHNCDGGLDIGFWLRTGYFFVIFLSFCIDWEGYSDLLDDVSSPFQTPYNNTRVKENLTSVGFEPTTSGLDLPILYRLSYESSTGAGRGNLGSESRLIFKWYRYIVREPRSTREIGNYYF